MSSSEPDQDLAAALERRRQDLVDRWNLGREVVLIGAGEPVGVPGRADLTYTFRSHSEYFYLTDRERPGGVLAFDPAEGWMDFVVPLSRDELVWTGARDDPGGVPISEFDAWLSGRAGRPLANLGAPIAAAEASEGLAGELRLGLNHVRRAKDGVELKRMRSAERATQAGFAAIQPLLDRAGPSASCRSNWRRSAFATVLTAPPTTRSSAAVRTPPCSTSPLRRDRSVRASSC